jgi:flagellar motor switch protein FliG
MVLLNLDKVSAVEIVKTFTQEEILELGLTMAQMEKLCFDRNAVEKVLKECLSQSRDGGLPQETTQQLFFLLKDALGEAQATEIMEQLKSEKVKVRPFENLKQMDSDTLSGILHGEHPQTISLVLSHLDTERTSQILQNFPEDKRLDIIERLLTLEEAPLEIIQQINDTISAKASIWAQDRSTIKRELGERIKNIADILNYLGDFGEKVVLKKLYEMSPEIAEQVQDHMFVFSDLRFVSPRDMQFVMSQVNTKTIAYALKGIPDELRDYILNAMSKRVRDVVMDEKAMLGMVPIGEVQDAQREVVKAARTLNEAGKIHIRKTKGAEAQMVE